MVYYVGVEEWQIRSILCPPVEDVCHRGLYFSRTFVTRRFTLDSSPLACPCLGITLAGTAGNSHRGDGREGED